MRSFGRVVMVGAAWLTAAGAASAARTSTPADLATDIKTTGAAILDGGSGGPDTTKQALTHLVEIAFRIAEDGKLSESSRAKLNAAVEKVRHASAFDEQAGAALREAYTSLNGGVAFAVPASVSGLAAAAAYGHAQIDRGISALQGGRPADAARDVVGVVIFVVTPMGRH